MVKSRERFGQCLGLGLAVTGDEVSSEIGTAILVRCGWPSRSHVAVVKDMAGDVAVVSEPIYLFGTRDVD